jgi:DNA-binding Xre family transcriptional regulator
MFISNIEVIMKEKGISLRKLADLSGVSKQTIVYSRSDTSISTCRLSTLGRIARALSVPVKDLFDGEYEEPPKEDPR